MYHNWSATEESMLLGVPKVVWLVSVDGVNECISNKVQNSGKMNTFLILLVFLLGSMSAVFSKIRVFCGWIWQFSGQR